MAKPSDWLGPFIEEELRAVISWKHAQQTVPEVKPERDGRFSDDGSNLRSVVSPSNSADHAKIQISKIVSIDDPVTLFVTDGFTQIKARFREGAVAALETGMGEPIDREMNGDVVRITQATVQSTHWGLPDGHIQLIIDAIEYLYHLRRPVGQPIAIHERNESCSLIQEIERLRTHDSETGVSPKAIRSKQPPSELEPALASQSVVEDGTPWSQRSVRLSQEPAPAQLTQPLGTQPALATQIPSRVKPKGPSLAEDGFEMENGVNLSRPVEPNLHVTNHHVPNTNRLPTGGPNETGAKLLSLLGKRKAEPPPEPPHPHKSRSPVVVEKAQAVRSSKGTTRIDDSSSPSLRSSTHLAPPPVRDVRASQQRDDASRLGSTSTQPRASTAGPVGSIVRGERAEPARMAPSSTPKPQQHSSPTHGVQKDYRRHRIPRDQQKLLDRRSSWIPSLPGERFPCPNVPIELLKKWNNNAAAEVARKTVSSEPPRTEVEQRASREQLDAGAEERESTASTSESETSSDDEPFSWPPTPSQRKPMLPPDSSMENVSRPSTAGNSCGNPQATVPEPSLQATPAQPLSQTSPNSKNALARSPIALSKRSGLIAEADKSPSQSGQISQAAARTQERTRSRPSTSDSDGPPASSNVTFMKPSPRAIKKPQESPRSPAVTLVKGTPVTKLTSNEEVDMEMEVPRSLGQDPAIAHRQRRSEHFKATQRREWLRKNYNPNPSSPYNFSNVYSAYKKAHPKDILRLSEFAEARDEVFPEDAASSTAKAAKVGTRKPEANVLSFSTLPQASTADSNAAVTTPASFSRARLSDTPASTPSKRRLPWNQGNAPASVVRQSLGGANNSPIVIEDEVSAKPALGKLATAPSKQVFSTLKDSTYASSSLLVQPAHQTQDLTVRLPQQPSASTPAGPSNKVVHPSHADLRASTKLSKHQIAVHATPRNAVALPNATQQNVTREHETSRYARRHDGQHTFREFAKAWTNLKPGGAFALSCEDDEDAEKEKRRKVKRLDVLAWELL